MDYVLPIGWDLYSHWVIGHVTRGLKSYRIPSFGCYPLMIVGIRGVPFWLLQFVTKFWLANVHSCFSALKQSISRSSLADPSSNISLRVHFAIMHGLWELNGALKDGSTLGVWIAKDNNGVEKNRSEVVDLRELWWVWLNPAGVKAGISSPALAWGKEKGRVKLVAAACFS